MSKAVLETLLKLAERERARARNAMWGVAYGSDEHTRAVADYKKAHAAWCEARSALAGTVSR